MITWDGAAAAAAEALGELIAMSARRGRAAARAHLDLDAAICGRAAVLASVALVLHDVVPTSPSVTAPRRRDLVALAEREPARALALVLRGRGRPELSRSPSELLDAALTAEPATRRWAAAGRYALIADRIWTSARRRFDDDHARYIVREAGALVELISMLDPDLARTAKAIGRPDLRAYLESTAGIGLVAHAVRTHAVEPAEDGHRSRRNAPAIRGPEPRRVLAPADPAGAVLATRRLTALVRTAECLTPGHLRAVAAVGRDLCILAAANAAGHSGDLQPQLAHLAGMLNRVVRSPPEEVQIVVGTDRILEEQIRVLSGYCRDVFASRAPAPVGGAAAHLAGRLATLVTALAEQAHTQVALGRWAVPDRADYPSTFYIVASTAKPALRPRVTDELGAAVALADALGHEITRNLPRLPALPRTATAHDHLRTVLHHQRPIRRPVHGAAPSSRLPPST